MEKVGQRPRALPKQSPFLLGNEVDPMEVKQNLGDLFPEILSLQRKVHLLQSGAIQ